jgi:sulfate/thiosulfate transport system permease protein
MPSDEVISVPLGLARVTARNAVAVSVAQARATNDPLWARVIILATALAFMGLFVVLPLTAVFVEAFHEGARVYLAAISNPEARSAIRLTLEVASIAVPFNVLFGACGRVDRHTLQF